MGDAYSHAADEHDTTLVKARARYGHLTREALIAASDDAHEAVVRQQRVVSQEQERLRQLREDNDLLAALVWEEASK